VHVVVVAGSCLERSLSPEALQTADLVVAADRGAEELLRVGHLPDLLVGDMDSLDPEVWRELEARGVPALILPQAKDETDLERALRAAVERGATSITVLGALGGPRVDHLVATLLLLSAPWLESVDVRLVDDRHEVALARGGRSIRGAPGDTVSLLPLTSRVEGVVTSGLLFPLRGEPLLQGTTRGVSNVLTQDEGRVTHGAGRLLIIHYHEEGGV
jgi:thiamine pyrophosphokinase